ncbi:tyrosine-type recombinase/integrase [Oerskovia sp. NPDC060338]|uniref:tyrosine-type recombinase/integrase n=1 Tax=Oerskovia sp. NPDC060338 TaxID=3347100 RepID=UPI003658827A
MTSDSMTWEAAIDAWLTALRAAGRPETTIRTQRQHVQQCAAQGGLPSPWVATSASLLAYMGARDWVPETRHGHRTSLRGFYAWGVRAGYIESSPAHELPSVRRTPPRPRPLPERLLTDALRRADGRTRLMVRLAGEHGLRRGEVAAVHSRDVIVDLVGYSLVVHGKGGRERVVPLADDVARAILGARGHAFPGQVDGHVSPWWVGKLVGRVLPEGWTTHTLRHRFATRAYAIDHDVFSVQELLGHASAETTRRYVQLPDDAKRRLVAAVAA